RDAEQLRGHRDRAAHVAAGAQHGLGPLARHDPEGLHEPERVDERGPRPAPRPPSREARRGERPQPKTRLGHGLGLEPALAAHEHDVDAGMVVAQLLGHGDAGEHVAPGAAPRDQDLQAPARDQRWRTSASSSPFMALTRYSSPAAARFTSSAEPPYETNGSGRPVVGARPVATARFAIA